MRRAFAMLALMGSALLLAVSGIANAQSKEEGKDDSKAKMRLAVVGFIDSTGHNLVPVVYNEVDTAISSINRIEMIERAALPAILKEIKLSEDGTIAADDQKKLGEVRGVDYIVYGYIYEASLERKAQQAKCKVTINFKISQLPGAETQNFKCVGETARTVSLTDNQTLLSEAISDAVRQFKISLIQMVFHGKVSAEIVQIKEDEGMFRINQGSADGISENMVFEVMKVGKDADGFDNSVKVCEAIVKQVYEHTAMLQPGKRDKDIFGKVTWSEDKGAFKGSKDGKRPPLDKTMTVKYKENFEAKRGRAGL